jgi:FtsP/CotA-like multicopper oxidase with cupredoxin domain
LSDEQTRKGMSGALIVEGLLEPFPTLRQLPERLLLLKDLQVENERVALTHIGRNAIRTVNGTVNPVIVLRPGETELWRIGNVGADLCFQSMISARRSPTGVRSCTPSRRTAIRCSLTAKSST